MIPVEGLSTPTGGVRQDIAENPPRAGAFEIRCHRHPKMKLAVHVR